MMKIYGIKVKYIFVKLKYNNLIYKIKQFFGILVQFRYVYINQFK